MAAIIECKQFDFPAVSLYRPHDPAGLWIIQVKETAKNETRSFSNNGIGNVAMTVEKLRLLRDALNRELADVPPPLPPVEIDCETVPVAVCGLPEFAEPTTAVEPKTERWAR